MPLNEGTSAPPDPTLETTTGTTTNGDESAEALAETDPATEPAPAETTERIVNAAEWANKIDEIYAQEVRRIYGGRTEGMARMITTLLGKGSLWARGEAGKEGQFEKKWVPELRKRDYWLNEKGLLGLCIRKIEENPWLRGLKIAGKGAAGLAAGAVLIGSSGSAALLLAGAPLGMDAILDTIQWWRERKLVTQWQARKELYENLKRTTKKPVQQNIINALANSQEAVDRLASSKKWWGLGRMIAKFASAGAAGAFLHYHGLSQGLQDFDTARAAEIIREHQDNLDKIPGINIGDLSTPQDVQDSAKSIVETGHGLEAGITPVELHDLKLISWMDQKHEVIQRLTGQEFLYNRGAEINRVQVLMAKKMLSTIQRGADIGHELTGGKSMVGWLSGVLGTISAADIPAVFAYRSEQDTPSPTNLPGLSSAGPAPEAPSFDDAGVPSSAGTESDQTQPSSQPSAEEPATAGSAPPSPPEGMPGVEASAEAETKTATRGVKPPETIQPAHLKKGVKWQRKQGKSIRERDDFGEEITLIGDMEIEDGKVTKVHLSGKGIEHALVIDRSIKAFFDNYEPIAIEETSAEKTPKT